MFLDEHSEAQNKVPSCYFCTPQSRQITLVLKSAMLNLRKLIKISKPKISETVTSKEKAEGSLGLQRLIRILFQRQQFELKLSQSCSHSMLQNRIRHSLSCKLEELQLLLELLCDKIARRNYELELMTTQIKNSQRSAIKLQQIAQLCPHKKQSTLNTEELCQPLKSLEKKQSEVKNQEEIKQIQYISPQTALTAAFQSPQPGLGVEMSYDNPFQYKMYVFGSIFYQ